MAVGRSQSGATAASVVEQELEHAKIASTYREALGRMAPVLTTVCPFPVDPLLIVWMLSVRLLTRPWARGHSQKSEAMVSWLRLLGAAGWQSRDREVAACGRCMFFLQKSTFCKTGHPSLYPSARASERNTTEGVFGLH
jgi:hypothetical protein